MYTVKRSTLEARTYVISKNSATDFLISNVTDDQATEIVDALNGLWLSKLKRIDNIISNYPGGATFRIAPDLLYMFCHSNDRQLATTYDINDIDEICEMVEKREITISVTLKDYQEVKDYLASKNIEVE